MSKYCILVSYLKVVHILFNLVLSLGMPDRLYRDTEKRVAINTQLKSKIRRKNEGFGRQKRKKEDVKSESKEDHYLYVLSMNEETWLIRG